jgi:hypothetical protein
MTGEGALKADSLSRMTDQKSEDDGKRDTFSAAVFAAGHDGCVEAFADGVGEFVYFVAAVDFDGLPRGAQRYLAVVASSQMLLQLGSGLRRDIVVNQFVEQRQKLCAGHFSPAFFFRK